MKPIHYIKRQSFIESILLLLLFIGGVNLFVFVKTSGIEEIRLSFNPTRDINLNEGYIRATVSGLLIGIVLMIHESFLLPLLTKNLSYFKKRLVWQLDIALIITVPVVLVFTVAEMIENKITFKEALPYTKDFLLSGFFVSYFVYYYLLCSLVSFLRRLRKTFGENVFYNYVMGKYAEPKEEDRVFMFVDLNNSTTIAEQVGHTKYSRLLNSCFDDIMRVTKSYKYDIYQFVGDEIVLTWLTRNDSDGRAVYIANTIHSHFEKAKEIYQEKFGVTPSFKAAISRGKVNATLVGDTSKTAAYHGDVLNTTARLLGLCKKYKCNTLFTRFYLNKLDRPLSFQTKLVDIIKLKGKSNQTKVYGLSSVPEVTKRPKIITLNNIMV